MSFDSFNPRDYCETDAELAAEVLEPDELAEYRQAVALRASVRSAKRRRTASAVRPDPWGGGAA